MSIKKDFSGKVVIITGSSAGIGATTAEEFSKAGAQVVITGRNAENLAEVGKQCLKASPKGLKPLEVVGDVANEQDCKRLIDSTIEKFGRLDILVNNAGMGAISTITDPNILDTFDKLIRINLRSVVHLTHLSVKHLEKTKGNIVNISSGLGRKATARSCIYGTTKSALDMFTKCTALELGPKGIRVNIVNPAQVETNFAVAAGLNPAQYEGFVAASLKNYPLGRIGMPIDVANAILFLASDECSWVTGINFVADGGHTP